MSRARVRPVVVVLVVVAAFVAVLALTVEESTPAGAAGQEVPAERVRLLDGTGELDLATLRSTAEPTVLWFWAPWCEVCNAEAPRVAELASSGAGKLRVVAIGGRDDFEQGPAFARTHRLGAPMVLAFDEPMRVWRAFNIPGQPAAVLLDRDGRERRRWLGAFEPAEVLTAAAELS